VQLARYSDSYDWQEISLVAHGVGAASDWVMNSESLNKKQPVWDKTKVDNSYSPFIKQMHALELAVHPYTLQDDRLVYRDNAYDESQLYVDKGIDGVFCEFPHSESDMFTHMGTKANFPSTFYEFLV